MADSEIRLNDGREIHLIELKQRHIYEGRIEGLPTQRENRYILKSLAEDGSHSWSGRKPHVIKPVETLIDLGRPYPFGTPARIPGVMCIGRFKSWGDDVMYYSELVIGWFQDEFALPIDADVIRSITALDWSKLAEEIEI